MKETMKNLKVGMRVKAICMGKLVGDYVVVDLGVIEETDGPHLAAFLAVNGDECQDIALVTERLIDSENNSVKVIRGQKIQCADYYVLPQYREYTLDDIASLKILINELSKQARVSTDENEREWLFNEIRDLESTLDSLQEESE